MENYKRTSLFITLEGGEGSGKTSQINRLAQTLTDAGYRVVTSREPGGTAEGESIRDLLVQRDGGNWTPMAEVLLLNAARSMHISEVIKPALDKGKVVICDRFTDSTLAYQGHGRGMGLDKIKEIQNSVVGDVTPDLTFILDIDVKDGLERSQKRLAGSHGIDKTEDRFERMDIEFHEKLRKGFLEIAKKDPKRCHVIDAKQSIDDISDQMSKITLECLEKIGG